jgi:hypothetical protein
MTASGLARCGAGVEAGLRDESLNHLRGRRNKTKHPVKAVRKKRYYDMLMGGTKKSRGRRVLYRCLINDLS